MINKPASVQLFNISEIRTCYMPRKDPGFLVRNKVRSQFKKKSPTNKMSKKNKTKQNKSDKSQMHNN